jgi:hypothetical protein
MALSTTDRQNESVGKILGSDDEATCSRSMVDIAESLDLTKSPTTTRPVPPPVFARTAGFLLEAKLRDLVVH